MNRKVGNARLFLNNEESFDLEIAGGNVSVRSLRAPDKEGPNEDAAAVIPVGDRAVVLAVADGVGGSPAGCEASTTAVETLQRALSKETDQAPLRGAILDAVEKANDKILNSGKRSATTLVIGEIAGHQLRCYHIGDSELFVVGQRGRIKHRTIAHSPTGFAVEAGLLDEQDAVQHEERHVIFNVVGSPEMRVDFSTAVNLALRDTVLLTSDGVLDNLYANEIVEIIRKGPLQVAADRLIKATLARMINDTGAEPSKPDDATIVLYRRTAKRA
jgi:serine/threonine protein phosphatase PrpC